MSNTNDAPLKALKAAFMEGYSRRATYNDTDVSDAEQEWKNAQPHLAALSQPAGAAQGWIPVEQRMPKSGQIVLALQKWDHSGMLGIIRAAWVAAKTEESSPDSDIGEYDEATDTYYDPEGWYEQISHWDEISAAGVSGATIVAWMPLPDVLLAASPAAPQADELMAQREDLLKALIKIERLQYHMELPPVESIPEQMRKIARAAIAKVRGGSAL